MNKSILTLSIAGLLIVASCSKSKNEVPTEPTCKVKLVEHIHNGSTDKYYYSYDSQSRITRVDYGKEQSNEYEAYTYTSNKVTWRGVGGDTEVYNLDVKGRITTAQQGSDLINFSYNSSGQLTEARLGNDVESYVYKNGSLGEIYNNSVHETTISASEIIKNEVVYAWVYGNHFLDFDEIGGRVTPYLGNKSMLLPAWIGQYYNTAKQSTYDYKYVGDKGNITEVTVINTKSLVKTTEIYRFTYECK